MKKKKVRRWEGEKVGKFGDGMIRLRVSEFGLMRHGAKCMAQGALFEVGMRKLEIKKVRRWEGEKVGKKDG